MTRLSASALLFGVIAGPSACLIAGEEQSALHVVESEPAAGAVHPASAPLRVRFDRYLDPGMDWPRAAALRSGDAEFAVTVAYDPAGPGLVVVPRNALRPGLGYVLRLPAERLRGIDGSTLGADIEIPFRAAPAVVQPAPRPVDFEADLSPIFDRACGCHGPEPAVYPPLTREALLTLPSRRHPDLPLVEPGGPLRSMLVLKVLPGYPGLLGESMPPEAPLPPDEIRLVVEWVSAVR